MLRVTFIEVGYLSYDDKAADIPFEVINRRYERKSLIVTTNHIFKVWNEGRCPPFIGSPLQE